MKKYMTKAIKRSVKNALAIVTAMTFFVPTDSSAFTYTPQWGDTYWDLSQEYGVSVDTLIATNGENLIAGVPIEIPEITLTPVEVYPTTTNTSANNTDTCNYIMPELGDGWYAIAARTGYSVNSLLAANNATLDTWVIYGQPIYLPDSNTAYYDYSVPTEKLLGSVTLYNTPWGNSWYNIMHASDMLNDVTVAPGETISFYDQFPNQGGAADGFLKSTAFGANGELIYVDGGGLCFVSTTWYQCAVLACDMIPVERWNHVNYVSYASPGYDAAVMLNTDRRYRQDMQFTNNTGHTVKFYFTYDWSGALTVSCYTID
jgi:vancomycin resistance protein YoaR